MTTKVSNTFFTDHENQALLRRLSQELQISADRSIEPEGLSDHLGQILDLILANPEKFDEFCSVNIEWIGRSFVREVGSYLEASTDNRAKIVRTIFVSAYRFLCELEFTQPGEPSFEVRRVLNFVHENLERFEGTDRQQLVYAAYSMPAQIVRRLISSPGLINIREFSQTVERSRELKEEWDEDFKQRIELIEGLKGTIGKLASEYNFVGLVHGFQALKVGKERERVFSFRSVLAIAACMLMLPAAQLYFVVTNLERIDAHKATLVYSLPTILALEVILLYFFRVVLGQFRSVKAQLLQVDLRISLCQFIESYSEYVSRLRKNDSSALTKFESLVFSGLVAGEADIPSTLDGAEQIASLIRSLRGS
ncbi:MAG: hypothetical protein GC151_14510 [Betaproteobacteria bacterium]|nr:hypothetical protein [Betaproteobacteria bacterium]